MSKRLIAPGTPAFPYVQGRQLLVQDGPRNGKLVKLKFNATVQRWLVDVVGDITTSKKSRGLVCFIDNWQEGMNPNIVIVSKVLNSGSACSGQALTLPQTEVDAAYLNNQLQGYKL